jgi:ketosteroid isomerase-like protein
MADTGEEVVRRFAQAMVDRDVAAIASCFTDDVVIHVPGRNPLSGTHRGKGEVMTRLFQAWEEAFGSLQVRVHDVLVTEDHVVMLSDRTAQRDGTEVDMRAASIYHCRDGKIAEAWLMEWDPYALDEFLGGD